MNNLIKCLRNNFALINKIISVKDFIVQISMKKKNGENLIFKQQYFQ